MPSAIVNIKALKGRLIAHKFNTGWAVDVVKSVEKKKSVAGQFLASLQSSIGQKRIAGLKNNKHCCIHLTNLAG